MARIPTEELERLKRDVSIQRLAESANITLKRHGKDYLGLCPFHNDKEPSLVISPDKNLWHCLGACNEGGDVIQWVMKSQGISFRHAVEILHTDALPSLAASSTSKTDTPVKHSAKRKLESLPTDQENQTLLNQIIDFYHEALLQSPEALAYLQKRGLGNPELIQRFKLGFANRTLAYRLPAKQYKAGKQLRGQLQEIGILRASGHEHFNGSVIIPVLDSEGNTVEIYGRKIHDNLRAGTPKHLYLPGSHQGIWNLHRLQDQEEVILCEALIDALTFYQAGYTNVTSSYGTAGFTPEHLSTFKQLNIKRVLIAYDRDEAGNKAAEKLASTLKKEQIDAYRLHFPKGMDANQYALEVEPSNKSLGVVIRSAEYMGEGEALHAPSHASNPVATIESTPQKPESSSNKQGPAESKDFTSLAAKEEIPAPESPTLPASAIPPKPKNPVVPEVSEHEVNISYGNRFYRIRGLKKNSSYEVLKVNVLVKLDESLHVDTFDLYSAKHRQAFARVAAIECSIEDKVVQRDLGQLLLQLETLQDKTIQEALQPNEPTEYTLDETERKQALELLNDKNLSQRIITDFKATGLVGEPNNALMGYLATVSRKLKTPLAIIVQSTSAAGKSALMDAVLKLVPEEDRVHYSAMTGQSLFYLGETNLKHKILGIAEEEGVRQAAYALKLLQSQGELTIASTGKDPQSGKLITEEYRVEGPVMLFLTTTAIDIDEELLNRCVVLTINESREQTAAIQQRQRSARTLSGLLASNDGEHIIRQHQNAQRLLRPLSVVNPYAEQLAFADSRTRTRRDHEKYLTLIDTIALLHQYQREIKTVKSDETHIEYIEVTVSDIALANDLAHDILGRSLDELPPPTRQLLKHLHTLIEAKINTESLRQNEVRFTRREVREASGLSNTQVGIHLSRLVELEYVYAHNGRNGQRFVYELVFDGEPDQQGPQLIGLIDVKQLRENRGQSIKSSVMTDKLTEENNSPTESLRSASASLTDTLHTHKNTLNPNENKPLEAETVEIEQTSTSAVENNARSYRSPSLSPSPSLAANASER